MRTEAEVRLKEVYRAVVRRLHPDAQSEMTAQKLEWWHQAQSAYQEKDVEQLEVILTLCEIEEERSTDKASLSLLQRITRQFKKSLRQIRRQLRECRRDPAWQFTRRKDLALFGSVVRRQLEHNLQTLKEDLRYLEEKIAHLSRQAQRLRRRASASA